MMDAPQAPIQTLSYRLTRADALAFKLLKQELTGKEKLILLVIVGCGGLVVGMLPDDLSPVVWWATAIAILAMFGALAIAWMNFSIRREAAAIPIPDGVVELEEWGDRLVVRSNSGSRLVAYDVVAGVARTDRHVFVVEGTTPLIVPAAAFRDAEEMKDFAERVDEASNRAQP